MTIRRPYNLFDELLHDAAPGFFIRPLHGDSLPAASQIRLDVAQSADAYTIHAELPGVAKEDIQVDMDADTVRIGAHIRQHDALAGEGNQVLRAERYYGEVSRSVQLPVEIDREAARARYENGVLMLTLPKKNAPGTQRLTVE